MDGEDRIAGAMGAGGVGCLELELEGVSRRGIAAVGGGGAITIGSEWPAAGEGAVSELLTARGGGVFARGRGRPSRRMADQGSSIVRWAGLNPTST
jgi:hypothetical protein